jgi:outer membrane protein assembly factor BamA
VTASLPPKVLNVRSCANSLSLLLLLVAASSGCSPFVKPALPGESDRLVTSVDFEGDLHIDPAPLKLLLAVRADAGLIPGQPYNPWRLAEDRRRIAAYWQNFGFFDVVVDKAEVDADKGDRAVAVTWKVHEGPRYPLRSVDLEGAPDAFREALEDKIHFGPGTPLDLHTFRVTRHALADVLREAGHLRCEVYSRAFVDKAAKDVRWVFYVDPGPRTVAGTVAVAGNRSISERSLRERVGIAPGDSIDLWTLRKRELDLMDLGAFATARIFAATGTEFESGAVPWESWVPPDTGGVLKIEQIDEAGRFVPRALAPEVDLRIEVVEAPSTQGQVRLGVNMDLERVDPYVGTRLTLRNALGELHHVVMEGEVGYGVRWRGDVDEPLGLYGSGKLGWYRPMALGRTGDLRLVASFDEALYAGYHWRTAALGLGLRTLIDTGLFFDLEPRLRWDAAVGLGAVAPAFAADADIAASEATLAGEVRASVVWDTRNDAVEALSGHLVEAHVELAPVGDRTWLSGGVDLRYFLPFSSDLGLGLRGSAAWVKSLSGEGVPVGARLFGGGAFGMRGFGARRLSLYGEACEGDVCRSLPLGASSLVEASLELRWLPYRKQVGAIAFVDLGGVGRAMNPLSDAVEVAVGAGLRVRLWHFPIGLDVAWRPTDDAMFATEDSLDQVLVFLRLGEAF